MNIRIVTGTLYKEQEKELSIGGVEAYIRCLNDLLVKEGHKVTVYQFSKEKFEIEIFGIKIVGTGISRSSSVRNDSRKMLKIITSVSEIENDILVFATTGLAVKNSFKHSIAIQHGVDWDVTKTYPVKNIQNTIAMIKSISKNMKEHLRISHCKNIVCVDYNFLNWYRAHIKSINNRFYVIPNFTDIVPFEEKKENSDISIIFARRFVEYRGTRLFAEAITEIFNQYPDIKVTLAGSGPDEIWLRNHFRENKNVSFITFDSKESIKIHKEFTIAIVPTIGSEGTSLSLLEAMAAGCAVIATNVGGMTNIILDGFNGLMVFPKKNDLVLAIKRLIEDAELRTEISKNAHKTVSASFS